MLQAFCLCGWLAWWATRRPRSHSDSHELCFLSQGHKMEMKCTAFLWACGPHFVLCLGFSPCASAPPCLPVCVCVCVSPYFTHSSTILSTLPPRANQETDIYFNKHNFHAAGDGGTHFPFRIMSFGGQGGCISMDITFHDHHPPPPTFLLGQGEEKMQ